VLAHRLLLARDAVVEGRTAEAVVAEVVGAVPVPAEGQGDRPAGS